MFVNTIRLISYATDGTINDYKNSNLILINAGLSKHTSLVEKLQCQSAQNLPQLRSGTSFVIRLSLRMVKKS